MASKTPKQAAEVLATLKPIEPKKKTYTVELSDETAAKLEAFAAASKKWTKSATPETCAAYAIEWFLGDGPPIKWVK